MTAATMDFRSSAEDAVLILSVISILKNFNSYL